jgi:hypothetical protein
MDELLRVQKLLAQRETDLTHLKQRAKEFVGEMRSKEEKLKQQVLDLQAAAQTKDQEIYQYKQEQLLVQQQQRLNPTPIGSQSAGDSSSCSTDTQQQQQQQQMVEQVERLTKEKLALVQDVQDSKQEWSVERTKVQQLEEDMTNLLNSQQQSAEVMATANSRSRDRQVQLDQALETIKEKDILVEQLRQEVETQRIDGEEARHELSRIEHQTSLQMNASSQVLKDLRSHVNTVELERDALVARLNHVRVSTKDDTLALEAEVRESTSKVKELQTQLSVDRNTFNSRRDLAKAKFSELVSRAEAAEENLNRLEKNKKNDDVNSANVQVQLKKLEIELTARTNERDLLLHEQKTECNSKSTDRERLVETLEKTEEALKDQRQKRMVAKNEILSMVRQLDGQRDVMTELFSGLQKVVTRVGTYVISCRSADSKCNDTLTLLDVDMNIEVVTIRSSSSSSSSSNNNTVVNVNIASKNKNKNNDNNDNDHNDNNNNSDDSDSETAKKKKKRQRKERRRRRSGSGGFSGGNRRTPRNPTDLVHVLEDELDVLGSLVDEMSKKVETLTNHIRNHGNNSSSSNRFELENGNSSRNGSGGGGCAGYVKRLFGQGGHHSASRTTVQRTSTNGKRRKNVRKYGKLEYDDDDDDDEDADEEI